MKKINVVILCLVSIIVSSLGTFYLSNIVQIKNNDKVIISSSDYDTLIKIKNDFEKEIELQGYIERNFYFDYDKEKFHEYMRKGLFEALDDPYSMYMSAEEYLDFQVSSEGEYSGIGVLMSINDDDQVVVISPIEDTPAYEAGILSGDVIAKVGEVFASKENFKDIADMIKGDAGTHVELTILREGEEEPLVFSVERKVVKLKAVKSRVLEGDIGYIKITLFDTDVYSEFKKNFEELKAKNIKKLIIDLRGNPGGNVEEVKEIADYLLGKQIIFYTETKNGDKEEFYSDSSKIDLPFVILVNGGSASASEILAGAVKDTKAGKIIGTKTFGKGIIQILRPLMDGDAFKLTVSGYFTPNGTSIHGVGIEPDILIEQADGYEDIEKPTDKDDLQLQKAIEELN